MIYHTLEGMNLHLLHSAFIAAFSDYTVKMDLSFSDFERMMRRRGLVSELSIGAFDGENLIGFSLTGMRVQNGIATAYDIATGIEPNYRRQGITSEIFMLEKAILKRKQVDQYLLEVINDNLPAVALYQKHGFQLSREFSCFQVDQTQLKLCPRHNTERISGIDWDQAASFWDFRPSWQNSISSVSAVSKDFANVIVRFNGEIAGYGLIEQKTGDIPQLAVNPKFRRLGIGTSLVAALAKNTEAVKIRAVNIEASQNSVLNFLTALGFEHYISQYEMILPIG